jgi:4-hydroxy-2-oxoheptanedioate aldolase
MTGRKSEFRRRMLSNELQIGMACFGAIELLEIGAARGIDFAWVDMEHTPKAIGDIYAAVRAADAYDLPLLVRLPSLEPTLAAAVLDAGAIGYLVPHVADPERAAKAVAAAKFPPDGARGMMPVTRGCSYDAARWDEYWPQANSETVVGVIVEDADGLENLEAICAVPGVDIVWLGPGDLSQALGRGLPGTAKTIAEATMKTLDLCRRNGKAAYCSVQVGDGGKSIASLYAQGFRLMAWSDLSLFSSAIEPLMEAGSVVARNANAG